MLELTQQQVPENRITEHYLAGGPQQAPEVKDLSIDIAQVSCYPTH